MTTDDTATAVATTATEELYYTNILRLQVKQLLSESILSLSSQTGLLDEEVKWTKDVHDYIETVQKTIKSIDASVLTPDDVVLKKNLKGFTSEKDKMGKSFWIQLHSDKAKKHFNGGSENGNSKDHEWKINFPGGEYLQMANINSYAANGAGLTTTVANANVIPTVDLAVLMPVKNRNEEDNVGDFTGAMIHSKDYLNGRYFDKRNILAIHIARFLSQKKQRKHIGSVHVVNEMDGDYRKVSLVLTPPLPDQNESDKQTKKKRKNDDTKSESKKKKNKIRFRVRLVFGVQYDNSLRNSIECNTGWIPSARLFPNRSNNKSMESSTKEALSNIGTPNYNSALASDMHHLSATQILSSVSLLALNTFSETWALLKIWCLQRGFLRGHDTFSEKSLGLSLAYLYRSKLVSSRMDGVQVFNVWMKFMSDRDWLGDGDGQAKKEESAVNKDNIRHSSSLAYRDLRILSTPGRKSRAGIVMPEINMTEHDTILNCVQNRLYASDMKNNTYNDDEKDYPKSLLDSFKVNTDSPIFLDPSMTENYFANLSPSFVKEVQCEAKKALKCIHFHGDGCSSRIQPFRQLFLEQQRFWNRYDAYLKFNINDIIFPTKSKQKGSSDDISFWGDNVQDLGNYEAISRGLANVLQMALGDRISALRIFTTGNGETSNTLKLISGETGTSPIVTSDEITYLAFRGNAESSFEGFQLDSVNSPVADGLSGAKIITVGLRINPDTCHRLVDRGPPADDLAASSTFVSLWGEKKAQLRRFKDGAIVHAVVWTDVEHDLQNGRVQLESDTKTGDIVERIARHIVRKHFYRHEIKEIHCPQFALKNMISLVECAQIASNEANQQSNSAEHAHKKIIKTFESLVTFLRKNSEVSTTPAGENTSKLGVPLCIDAVEALSPCLRYSEVFPPMPHPSLGSNDDATKGQKVAGAIVGEPILIQIRFQGSEKWPQDINAMGAAKCAMLMQLAEGIENMKRGGDASCGLFDGPINVMPTYLDLGYNGYNFRIIVRADEELKMLSSLRSPTQEAIAIKQVLQKRHVICSMHHFTIHGLHTKYSSAANTLRLLKRWLAAHMLSDLIPGESLELIVASVFTDPAPLDTPNTVPCAFIRCLKLLWSHDWSREPLIVDPEGHIDITMRSNIVSTFETVRGSDFKHGPPMFIVAPYDLNEDYNTWKPTFTSQKPERVVLSRVCALAKRSYEFLLSTSLRNSKTVHDQNGWNAIFQESSNALKSYSFLLRVDPDLIFDTDCGSTAGNLNTSMVADNIVTPYQRSIEKRSVGPKNLRKKRYKNLASSEDNLIYSWNPISDVVMRLRSELGHLAVFFYNEYTPDIIGCLWRPDAFKGQAFSAMHSEYKRPIENAWEENSLVITNASDVLRVIRFICRDIAVDVKVFDDRNVKSDPLVDGEKASAKRKRMVEENDDEDTSSDDE